MSEQYHIPISVLISGKDYPNAWARVLSLIMAQPEIVAGERYKGNAKMTRDLNMLMEFDEDAVDGIVKGELHPSFESKASALDAYDHEFTYQFVEEQNIADEKYQFVYNYMSRFVEAPLPHEAYKYQGRPYQLNIPQKYIDWDKYSYDQLAWMHDSIREDGISRQHQVITWIPPIDCFIEDDPCLQRIWCRVLVPKPEWHKYAGCIPMEVHIEYRSWDIGRGQPSNLFGLTRMIYRYVCGNLTKETEYIRDVEGKPIRINNEGNVIDFKIVRLVCFGDAAHVYEDFYNKAKTIKPISRMCGR